MNYSIYKKKYIQILCNKFSRLINILLKSVKKNINNKIQTLQGKDIKNARI